MLPLKMWDIMCRAAGHSVRLLAFYTAEEGQQSVEHFGVIVCSKLYLIIDLNFKVILATGESLEMSPRQSAFLLDCCHA